MEKYNLVVIGAGSGGLMVAAGAAGLGARVAMVEQHKMGGDCLNYGCVPSKALIAAARRVAAARMGGGPAGGAAGNSWAQVAGGVQAVIDTIAPHDSVERFTSLGVDVFLGQGRLSGPKTVQVDLHDGGSRTLQTRAVVIATGSSPAVPPIPGLAEAGYITNEQAFAMPEQPGRLLVMGGGAIGVELGQSFARLGSQVTLAEMLPHVLPREDEDAAGVVAEALLEDGLTLLPGHAVTRVEKVAGGKRVTCRPLQGAGAEHSAVVEEILVATGRRLAVEGVGLEEAGVAFGPGGIPVNARMQTSVPSVYACGDVVGAQLFTHAAGQQARVIVQNALLPFKTRMDYRVMPACTFSDPELARVGLNEAEARSGGVPHRVIKVPYSGMDRAVCDGDTRGFLKVLTPPGKDGILGATLVGAHAGEIIHEIALAMQAGLGLKTIAAMVHLYPSRAEILRKAGDEARKAGFTPRLQRMFGAYLRWRRR